LYYYCLGELADSNAKRGTEQQQAQALRADLDQTIGIAILILFQVNYL